MYRTDHNIKQHANRRHLDEQCIGHSQCKLYIWRGDGWHCGYSYNNLYIKWRLLYYKGSNGEQHYTGRNNRDILSMRGFNNHIKQCNRGRYLDIE